MLRGSSAGARRIFSFTGPLDPMASISKVFFDSTLDSSEKSESKERARLINVNQTFSSIFYLENFSRDR